MSEQLAMDVTWNQRGFDETKARSTDNPWTEERVEQLRQLVAEGLSGSEIADRLGTSRSAILGKMFRLKLHSKITPTRSRPRKPRPERARVTLYPNRTRKQYARKAPTILEQPILDCVPLNLTFAELKSGQCRYPYGETPNMLFCGLAIDGKSSYCASHRAICHNHFSGGWERPDLKYRNLKKLGRTQGLSFASAYPREDVA